MKSMIPDWLPKLFVKAEGTVREATTKKFSDFQKITDTEGMEVVGLKGGANVRADIPPATTSMIATEPDEVLRNSKGQFMSTKEIPELANQKEVNRFLWESIESIDVGGGEGVPTNDPRITDDQIDDWDLSASWGNHATAGYAKDVPPWDYEFTANTLVLRDGSGNLKAKKVVGQTLQMTTGGTSNITPRPDDHIFYSSANNQLYKNSREGMRDALGITGEHDSADKGAKYRYLLESITTNIANRPGQMTVNDPSCSDITQVSLYPADVDSKPSPDCKDGYYIEFSHNGQFARYEVTGADSHQYALVKYLGGTMQNFTENVTYDTHVYQTLDTVWDGNNINGNGNITADGDMICTNLTVGQITQLAGGRIHSFLAGDKPTIDFRSDSGMVEVKLYTDSMGKFVVYDGPGSNPRMTLDTRGDMYVEGDVYSNGNKISVAEAFTRSGAQTLNEGDWSIKDENGSTYVMIHDGEVTMYHVADPEAPKQPTNKSYVDEGDKALRKRIEALEATVNQLQGVIVSSRYTYTEERGDPTEGLFMCKNSGYDTSSKVSDCRYLHFNLTDADGKTPNLSRIKDQDVVRVVSSTGGRADWYVDGGSDGTNGLLLIGDLLYSDFEDFEVGAEYTVTILGV